MPNQSLIVYINGACVCVCVCIRSRVDCISNVEESFFFLFVCCLCLGGGGVNERRADGEKQMQYSTAADD